jgi:hypothetical protein
VPSRGGFIGSHLAERCLRAGGGSFAAPSGWAGHIKTRADYVPSSCGILERYDDAFAECRQRGLNILGFRAER